MEPGYGWRRIGDWCGNVGPGHREAFTSFKLPMRHPPPPWPGQLTDKGILNKHPSLINPDSLHYRFGNIWSLSQNLIHGLSSAAAQLATVRI
jgi:hypothetical protein